MSYREFAVGMAREQARLSVVGACARVAGRLQLRHATTSSVVVEDGSTAERPSGALRAAAAHPHLLGALALALAYFGAAQIGYALNFAGPIAAVVWLPAGVGIAFVYFGGVRLWPGVVVGDLLANDYSALPLGSALGQTCGNLVEVLVAGIMLRRLTRRMPPLASVEGLCRILLALAAGTAISATIGSLSLRAGGAISSDAIPRVWRTWWLGDFSGALVVVPLALAWWPPKPLHLTKRMVESALLLGVVITASEITVRTEGPWSYLVLCALIWAALRFGQRGASLAILTAVVLTVWNTMHYDGPFDDGPFASGYLTRNILSTQLFIAVAALSTLCLAAVVAERERIAAELGASRARLIKSADTERRRIERNLHDGAQQRLLGLVMRLRLAAEEAAEVPERGALLLEDAAAQLQIALDELRQLAHGIHPGVLSQLGFADAARSLAAGSSVPVSLLGLPSTRVDEGAEAVAYYVLAEALTNAQRHSRASQIRVDVSFAKGVMAVEVGDNGVGGASEHGGTGLVGIRDRVETAGGKFEVESPLGRGTRVAAQIPASQWSADAAP